jgi:hypothetical protein
VKLSEIQVGEYYAIHLDDKTKYQDAEHQGYAFGDLNYPTLPLGIGSQHYAKVRAVAVGVPFGKRAHGVRIEYTYTMPRPCPTCGHGVLRDPGTDELIADELTNEVTVHYSLILGQWDEHELHRAIRRHEQNEWIAARRNELIEEEIRNMLGDS